jgi:hypothetical protein
VDLPDLPKGGSADLIEEREMLTRKDVDDFGYELLDVAQRAAQHAVGPELQELRAENQELRDEVSRAAKLAIDQVLDREVPGWREINNDPRFHQWLLLPEPHSGIIRDRLLKDAAAAADAPRVARFFRRFLAAVGQAPADHASRRNPRASSGKPVYTRGQISQMWTMRRRGQIGDAEWAKWEVELIRAGREGRIVGALDADGVPRSR